eukprot:TRINITY_DN4784_c0_g1_i1.p1 TRINITY_DN4784_c0_g1~~TRINITY_DN4784_c0_g1_i1.p1  ORF type:complete len:326 (+),score=45.51 TRINITY_DN4784_c0_g1_i1:51-1028(+)
MSKQGLLVARLARLLVKPALRWVALQPPLFPRFFQAAERIAAARYPLPVEVSMVDPDAATKALTLLRQDWGLQFEIPASKALRFDHIAVTDTKLPVVLYLHGGGFVACSPILYRMLTVPLAAASGTDVFALHYPLGPFPSALVEAVTACISLLARAGSRGVVLAGDSAGGNLAVATALALTRAPWAAPLLGVAALSPWLDLSVSGPSVATNAHADPLLPAARVCDAAALYLRDFPQLVRHPLVSPVFASRAEVRRLPPLRLHVGSTEVLLDDSRRFAALGTADVHTCTVWPEMVHVFPLLHAVVPEARAALLQIGDFVRTARAAR